MSVTSLEEYKFRKQKELKKKNRKPFDWKKFEFWFAMICFAFLPWMCFLLLLAEKSGATPAQHQELKLMAALMAAFVSPMITLIAVKLAYDEPRKLL